MCFKKVPEKYQWIVSGLIASIFGVVITYIIYILGIPFNNVYQTLIAVGIASFISAAASIYFKTKKKT